MTTTPTEPDPDIVPGGDPTPGPDENPGVPPSRPDTEPAPDPY